MHTRVARYTYSGDGSARSSVLGVSAKAGATG
jgi:hypothetical protein